MTDIHLGAGQAHLAERACRSIFGEDVSNGPVCSAPQYLLDLKANKWWQSGDLWKIPLVFPPPLPPATQPDPLEIIVDKCNVILGGKLIGTCLRMDAISHAALQKVTAAWKAHNLALARAH